MLQVCILTCILCILWSSMNNYAVWKKPTEITKDTFQFYLIPISQISSFFWSAYSKIVILNSMKNIANKSSAVQWVQLCPRRLLTLECLNNPISQGSFNKLIKPCFTADLKMMVISSSMVLRLRFSVPATLKTHFWNLSWLSELFRHSSV